MCVQNMRTVYTLRLRRTIVIESIYEELYACVILLHKTLTNSNEIKIVYIDNSLDILNVIYLYISKR